MGYVKMGISLYPGLPDRIRAVIIRHARPVGGWYGDYRRYYLPEIYAIEMQQLMSEEICAVDCEGRREQRVRRYAV